jgi:hypothetical protein
MTTNATRERSLELLQTITRQFDRGGLRDLCFVLGVDTDDLPAEGKSNVARELAARMERQGRLPELEQAVGQMAPRGRAARGPRNRRVMIERVRRSWVSSLPRSSVGAEAETLRVLPASRRSKRHVWYATCLAEQGVI